MSQKTNVLTPYPITVIGIVGSLIYFTNYLSFLMTGVILILLIVKRIVSEACGEAANITTSKEELQSIRELSKDRKTFLISVFIVGLLLGTALYLIKMFFVTIL